MDPLWTTRPLTSGVSISYPHLAMGFNVRNETICRACGGTAVSSSPPQLCQDCLDERTDLALRDLADAIWGHEMASMEIIVLSPEPAEVN